MSYPTQSLIFQVPYDHVYHTPNLIVSPSAHYILLVSDIGETPNDVTTALTICQHRLFQRPRHEFLCSLVRYRFCDLATGGVYA